MPPGGWQQPLSTAGFLPAPGQLASWWSRVGANVLDALVQTVGLIVIVFVIAIAAAAHTVAGFVVGIPLGIFAVVAYIAYGAYFMAREGERNGQTLGKQAVGIRVIRDNGEPFGIGQGILREFAVKIVLFGWVGGLFFIPPLLDVLWPLWDDSDRALHDMIATTHVVRA